MSSPASQYLPRLRQASLASMGTINAAVDWVLLVPIYSLLSSIEILYYITNLLYFPHNTFTQLTLRLCTSLLILSLSTSGGNLSKSTSNSHITDTKARSKNLIIILMSFVLLLCESSFMEDIKWAYLAQEDREILILDFILESLWRFLILDFMAAGFVGKLLQTLLSARLVSIIVKNDWHIIMRMRFLCGGVLIGLALLGVEKLKDMKLSKAFGETSENEQEDSPRGRFSTKCVKKSSSLTVQSPQKISVNRTYTEASSEIDSSKDLKPLILTPKDSKVCSNDSALNLNPLKVKEENSVDTAGLARILNYLPEGVIVLDPKGQVKFMNRYMRNIFEFDEKITLQDLSQSLSDFKFREASIQVSHSLNVIRETSFSGPRNMPWKLSQESIPKLSRAEFLQRVQKISSLESLFFYCITDPETREIAQKYVPTFQTRYHQQSTNEWYSIEMKIHLLSENEKQFVILLRDITDRENKLITLEKEKILYRDNLIASFSHELRTPLNSNLAFLEQCMDSSQIPTQVKKDLVKPALDSGRLLLFMVSDILDYSLMILNKMRLDIKPFDISQTVRQCLDLFHIKANHKKLKLSLIADEGISPVVFSDHRRISQVLTNLLSNAVQFTTEGEIQVIISKSADRNIKITVQDTGIGMEKHAQERLERTLSNEILKEKLSEASVGVGLGLFISNKMVKTLSGDGETGIQFKSEYGRGSRFFFEVENREPKEYINDKVLRKAKQRDSVLSETDEKIDLSNRLKEYSSYTMKNTFRTPRKIMSEGSQVKALIVDDEIFNIIVIENFCKSMGISTEKAFNGREALNKLRMHSNDNAVSIKIVFMDINMPLMDGYESTVAILDMIEKGEIEDVIVVGVTAYVSRDMIEKGLECGMTEVLNKPVTKESLVEVLKKYKFIK